MADASRIDPAALQEIADWLLDRGQTETPITRILEGFGERLTAAGMPVCRINIGGLILHPNFVAQSITWDDETGRAESTPLPRLREMLTRPQTMNSPYNWLETHEQPFLRQRLDAAVRDPDFPIFDRLQAQGMTDYLAFLRSSGRPRHIDWFDGNVPRGTEGVLGAFSTRHPGGFADGEIAALKRLCPPLGLAVKVRMMADMGAALLDAYLGPYTGRQVREGQVQRGDGERIDCVIWYSDLRNSTAMAERLPLESYLNILNGYFECTAGAVTDAGGEVLKFIGDAVLAIFPLTAEGAARAAACARALDAAREARARLGRRNSEAPPDRIAQMGISLHVGAVMYGNVGTERRLDFTATGPAVNMAVRLEGLCKSLAMPLAASSAFAGLCGRPLTSRGRHKLAGMAEEVEVFTLPEAKAAD